MKYQIIILVALFFLPTACGSGNSTKLAGLSLDMPNALKELKLDEVQVSGSVWQLDADGNPLLEVSPSSISTRTIRGNYALPVAQTRSGKEYEFRIAVAYKATAYAAPSLAALAKNQEADDILVEVNPGLSALCPALSLVPDASLSLDRDGTQWLKLCEFTVKATYHPKKLIEISEDQIVCTILDADGDGVANLAEMDLSLDPFSGDYDGDCVSDEKDVFPKDAAESADLDGDGIGDHGDNDTDGDGLLNDEEVARGTSSNNPDSDGDGVVDGSDNCALVGAIAAQDDADDDGVGDVCDDDADNDGLADSVEETHGTNPLKTDTDDDGVGDKIEVDNSTNPLSPDSDGDGSADAGDVFPLDATEQQDGDGDGLGNNQDLCPTVADASNLNTDGDALGNVCDADDDNDGVPDELENKVAGMESLLRDSDGDGLVDQWGSIHPANLNAGDAADLCPTLARTADNQAEHDFDADGDGFGLLCDFSDDPVVDAAAAQINFAAIFADPENGDDGQDGSREQPVQSLERAGKLAGEFLKDVYVAAGTFNLVSEFIPVDGVRYYGGFDSGFSTRNPQDTIIQSEVLETLVVAEHLTSPTTLDGFVLRNLLTSGAQATGVLLNEATLNLSQSQIQVTDAPHAIGIDAEESQLTVTASQILLSGGDNHAVGMKLAESSGSVSTTSFQIADFAIRTGIQCLDGADSAFKLTDVQFDLWSDLATQNVNFVYVQDCSVGTDRLHYELPMENVSDYAGFADGGGNLLDGLF